MDKGSKYDRFLERWDRTSKWVFRLCIAVVVLCLFIQVLAQFSLFRFWMNPVERLEGVPFHYVKKFKQSQ